VIRGRDARPTSSGRDAGRVGIPPPVSSGRSLTSIKDNSDTLLTVRREARVTVRACTRHLSCEGVAAARWRLDICVGGSWLVDRDGRSRGRWRLRRFLAAGVAGDRPGATPPPRLYRIWAGVLAGPRWAKISTASTPPVAVSADPERHYRRTASFRYWRAAARCGPAAGQHPRPELWRLHRLQLQLDDVVFGVELQHQPLELSPDCVNTANSATG